MGATLASISGAVWAQLLSGESSSSSGGVVEHVQHPQHPQHPQHSQHPQHPQHPQHSQHPQHPQHPHHQQLLSPSFDAFRQCGGSSPPRPLAHHWEAPAAQHDMDYPSHPHHHYMMAPPPPPLVPNNSGEPIAISQLSNVQWTTSTGESLHSGLLHHQQQHQQHQQHPHSDFQEPFIVPNPHVTLLNETSEDSREGKRPAGLSLGNCEEMNSSPDLYKRPRLEPQATSAATSASACVPFKSQVRKEKLGERITALQQLVSPFGKTDTASVLLEAIGYIKFLQEQVQVLSTPYMKPNVCAGSINHHDSHELGKMPGWPSSNNCKVKGPDDVRQDLRSRGLCLVPVSCTLQVANDNGADFWTPAIGGSCR